MVDFTYELDQYTVDHTRPRDGITSPNSMRVYNNAPRRVSVQIRYAKGIATAILSIEQLDVLLNDLIEARNETFPPIEPRTIGPVLKAPPKAKIPETEDEWLDRQW